MSKKRIAPIAITENQNKWLHEEKARTGNTYAVIIRNLIQDQITKKG